MPLNIPPGLLRLLQGQMPPQQGFNLGAPRGFNNEYLPPPDPVPSALVPQQLNVTQGPPPPPSEEGMSPGMAALTGALGAFLPTRPIAAGLGGYYGAKQAQSERQQQQMSAQQRAQANDRWRAAIAANRPPSDLAQLAVEAGQPEAAREYIKAQSGLEKTDAEEVSAAQERLMAAQRGKSERTFTGEQNALGRASKEKIAGIYAGAMGHRGTGTGKRAVTTQLTTQEANALSNAAKALEVAEQLTSEVKPEYIGKLTGPFNVASGWVGKAPEGFTEFRAKLTDSMAGYLKSISGLVVTDAEAKRLAGLLNDAGASDSLQEFEGKMAAFKNSLHLSIRHGLDAMEANNKDVSKFRALYGEDSGIPQMPDFDNMSESELDAYLNGK